MQSALAAEHAAVYGYGVVGARLRGKKQDDARSALSAHRLRRDGLRRTVQGLGGQPVAAEPAYRLPFPVPDEAAAMRLAAELEQRVAAVYADLVQATSGELRSDAARAVRDANARAARWGGPAEPATASPAPGRA